MKWTYGPGNVPDPDEPIPDEVGDSPPDDW